MPLTLLFSHPGSRVFLTPFRAAASTDYNPPADKWNGYKVYLSPSNQSGNVGCFDYVEKDGARAIALRVKDYLVSYGYKVRIGSGDYKANTTDSNNWGSDVHIPIHSNAGIWDCDGIDSSNGGTWLGYGESDDEEIAAEIFYQMAYDSPGTDDRLDEDINLDGSSTWYGSSPVKWCKSGSSILVALVCVFRSNRPVIPVQADHRF